MPYKEEWVDPEVFLEHHEVTVYHTYKNDDFSDRNQFWFTTEADGEGDSEFDVRKLPGFDSKINPYKETKKFSDHAKDVIKKAIEAKLIPIEK